MNTFYYNKHDLSVCVTVEFKVSWCCLHKCVRMACASMMATHECCACEPPVQTQKSAFDARLQLCCGYIVSIYIVLGATLRCIGQYGDLVVLINCTLASRPLISSPGRGNIGVIVCVLKAVNIQKYPLRINWNRPPWGVLDISVSTPWRYMISTSWFPCPSATFFILVYAKRWCTWVAGAHEYYLMHILVTKRRRCGNQFISRAGNTPSWTVKLLAGGTLPQQQHSC